MDEIQSVLKKLQNLLYLDKIDINSFPVNELKKIVYLKLNIISENIEDTIGDEFEAILNILLKEENKEGAIHLLNFLGLLLKRVDSLQEERKEDIEQIEGLQERVSYEISKRAEKNALEFYAIKYGIQKKYKDTYHLIKDHAFRGKGCIYCVITGDYDPLENPQFVNPELDYICFTDNKNLTSNVWNIVQINEVFDVKGLDKVRIARYIKIVGYQFLKEYDYSIYIDGKVRIRGDMLDYIEKYAKLSSLLCCPHYMCRSLYDEVPIIIKKQLDDTTLIENQIERYKSEGFPDVYQQIDSTCLIRRHSDNELDEVMNLWWLEVKNGSKRDQLSFTYACWKKKYIYDISDVFTINNNYFFCIYHG